LTVFAVLIGIAPPVDPLDHCEPRVSSEVTFGVFAEGCQPFRLARS
jgi:hypothetical protein